MSKWIWILAAPLPSVVLRMSLGFGLTDWQTWAIMGVGLFAYCCGEQVGSNA